MELVEPHFFGPADHQLFGVYHAARRDSRQHGVVLCPPAPQEYMRSHLALRSLAHVLVNEGFHVLRFDYYASGDSAGEAGQGSLSEWRSNIVAAAADLRECSGARQISMIGYRLGATLAATAGTDVVNLVMWEPVINGAQYLDELRVRHRRQFSRLLFPPPVPHVNAGGDVLGVPLAVAVENELLALDLRRQAAPAAQHVALVVSAARSEYGEVVANWERSLPGGLSLTECKTATGRRVDEQDAMLMSTNVLQTLASVLTRRAA
jgi:pimeloyl-ACP methyl ester carboxylesterase